MKTRDALMTLVATLLIGCAPVGPNYRPPEMEAPDLWMEAEIKAKIAVPFDEIEWWKDFGDPHLDSLIRQAMETNLDIPQARARIAQARADVAAAKASFWPSAAASGSATRSKESENVASSSSASSSSGVSSASNLYTLGFDASWEIDVFGGTRRKVEAASAREDSAVEDLHGTLLTLIGDVAKNYVDLRAAQDQLDITCRNAKAQQENVAVTRERCRLGLTASLDVAQAEAQQAATESDIPTLEASIKQSIHRLSILAGKPPGALYAELSVATPLPKADGVMAAGLPSELLVRRPDLRRAERELAAASADIGAAEAELYPKFDLTFGMGLQSGSASKLLALSSGYWSVAPAVSMLLFDGGKARAAVQGKRAVYEETLYSYRSSFLSVLEEVENALAKYYAERTRRLCLAESVRSNEDAVALANERYRRGLTTFLDVLVVQKSLYSAQIDFSKSEALLLTDLITMYKALGGGWNRGEAGTPLASVEGGMNRDLHR